MSRLDGWVLGFSANAVISVAYFGISATIFGGLAKSRQWRKNPLALATGFIFLSCGVGHAVHGLHAFVPDVALAQRAVLSEWHVWVVDGATALIGVWYFTLRGRFPALVRGAALFEDMQVRQKQALEIHDNIVQGIVKAKLSLESGQSAEGQRELEETLVASRKIMSDLLAEGKRESRPLRPGDLVRRGAGSRP